MTQYETAPLSLEETVAIFDELDVPWWIGGGWAIDLFLGRVTREHDDVDICLLRRDQHVVHELLRGWDIRVADPPGTLRSWKENERLDVPLDCIWCRRTPDDPYSVWLLLNESDGDDWIYHRDPRVRKPLGRVVRRSAEGYPYLAPEIALLLKSKQPREKDERDFDAAVPSLDADQRASLRDNLAMTSPDDDWLDRL